MDSLERRTFYESNMNALRKCTRQRRRKLVVDVFYALAVIAGLVLAGCILANVTGCSLWRLEPPNNPPALPASADVPVPTSGTEALTYALYAVVAGLSWWGGRKVMAKKKKGKAG